MERMEQTVPDTNEQAFNISFPTLRGMPRLVIDESGMPKKGKHSAGVARQYCGQLGKVENCQVGVYGALAHRDKETLTDARLFVPREWTNDPERRRRAASGSRQTERPLPGQRRRGPHPGRR